MPTWPTPVAALRDRLPTELRLLRGALGLAGGLLIALLLLATIISGNWQLGFANDRLLTTIYLFFVPAALGILSPLWYWLGRPLWVRVGRPAAAVIASLRDARFLHGLAATLAGLLLVLPVDATARFWTQTRLPFGLLLGVVGPLWFWLGRPILRERLEASIPGDPPTGRWAPVGTRWLPGIAALIVLSLLVTQAIALPVVAVGDAVDQGTVAVAVDDARLAETVTDADGESMDGEYGWRFLLVRVVVTNHGRNPASLPGGGYGDIVLIAPECSAQTFGEPSNNCNEAFVGDEFTVERRTYRTYRSRYRASGGEIAAGERLSGWVVYRIEGRPVDGDADRLVIVDDVGRWAISY